MKLGLETESLHLLFQNKRIDIFGFIDKAHELGFDGVLINVIKDYNLDENWGTLGSNDDAHLNKVKQRLQDYGMFVEIDMKNLEFDRLLEVLKVAHKLGAEVVRTYIPIDTNSDSLIVSAADGAYDRAKIKQDFDVKCLERGIEKIRKIVPYLEKYRIKLALENHEYETSSELVGVIEEIDSRWVGLLFDFGNSMMAFEEPLQAAKNMAPYTFSTHFKDHIIIPDASDKFGYVVCGVPVGDGNIDLDEAYRIIFENSSVTRINLEMCYPYCAQFKRSVGAGGVDKLGEGAFKIEKPIYDPEIIKPKQYYYPHEVSEEILNRLCDDQLNGLIKSAKYLMNLRDKYSIIE